MSRLWSRLFGRDEEAPPPALAAPEESEAEAPEPAILRGKSEAWLQDLSSALAEGERRDEVGGELFWGHVRSMWDGGQERLAIEWLEKFIGAPATSHEAAIDLRSRLVELQDDRGDLGPAKEHLEALIDSPAHEVRAQYLLGEYHRRRGDEGSALRHFEAVLARDVDYPNVRARVERLRAARGRDGAGSQGETIAGSDTGGKGSARYRLVREIGRGATGVVYLALDSELRREVAVKLLHPHLARASTRSACAQFFAEARLAASLRHPNIVGILDLDEAARRLVMELASGGTLRDVLAERGPRKIGRALERHVQVLSALAAAHRRGIVHRDVKPANLMFRRDADVPGTEIMLGDFGIANLPSDREGHSDETADEVRARGKAVGTLAYMPPEQRAGEEVDGRADVYAAGVVLYEMLVGKHPLGERERLTGHRSDSDFALPDSVAAPAELREPLETHLRNLGQPDLTKRMESKLALEEARHLRDRAILLGL